VALTENLDLFDAKLFLDSLCNLAIRNGTPTIFENESQRTIGRYELRSEKMSFCIISFVNFTKEKYWVYETIETTGKCLTNVTLDEDDTLKIELPPLSKKAFVFRFDDRKDMGVKVLDHCMKPVKF
jgi:hypothetical protein